MQYEGNLAGLAESNGSLPPGGWIKGTPYTPGSALGQRSVTNMEGLYL